MVQVSGCERSSCLDHLTFSQDIQVMGEIRMFGSFNFFTRHSRVMKVGEDKKTIGLEGGKETDI